LQENPLPNSQRISRRRRANRQKPTPKLLNGCETTKTLCWRFMYDFKCRLTIIRRNAIYA
jgi:hypothetical protein